MTVKNLNLNCRKRCPICRRVSVSNERCCFLQNQIRKASTASFYEAIIPLSALQTAASNIFQQPLCSLLYLNWPVNKWDNLIWILVYENVYSTLWMQQDRCMRKGSWRVFEWIMSLWRGFGSSSDVSNWAGVYVCEIEGNWETIAMEINGFSTSITSAFFSENHQYKDKNKHPKWEVTISIIHCILGEHKKKLLKQYSRKQQVAILSMLRPYSVCVCLCLCALLSPFPLQVPLLLLFLTYSEHWLAPEATLNEGLEV